ncbi:MAG: thiamine pyrophosphate-binding protein [Candidatus Sulfotelmatobacter sp.]|jgi:pyruvate dehydrogenase (quinone)
MAEKVADLLWEMLANAGVKRCYGIVGDALNAVIDGLRRNGRIEFIHVRHEEYGVFAAVAEAYLAGNPVAVCGTAGPGVVHLFNGLMDARKEGAPIIAIAGDVETSLIDTEALEELNPYKCFEAASLYTGRLINPEQARSIINTAILTAVLENGPTVISIPGDVAAADVADHSSQCRVPTIVCREAHSPPAPSVCLPVGPPRRGHLCSHRPRKSLPFSHRRSSSQADSGRHRKGRGWVG